MARRTKAQIQREKTVDRIAQNAVYRIPINIMDCGKVYKKAESLLDQEFDELTAQESLRTYVETLRAA